MKFKPTVPHGCRSLLEHEQALVELAEALEARAKALLNGAEARIGVASANLLAQTAVRARKQAAELAREREDNEITNHLLDRREQLQSRRKGSS